MKEHTLRFANGSTLTFAGIPMFVCAKAPNDGNIWRQPAHQTRCVWCGELIADHDANGLTLRGDPASEPDAGDGPIRP